jgi:hypothetical protein
MESAAKRSNREPIFSHKPNPILKRKGLAKSFWPARMKGLRFHLIGVAGKVVSHARMTFLKITEGLIGYRQAKSRLPKFSSAW